MAWEPENLHSVVGRLIDLKFAFPTIAENLTTFDVDVAISERHVQDRPVFLASGAASFVWIARHVKYCLTPVEVVWNVFLRTIFVAADKQGAEAAARRWRLHLH
jgi:hypothetical protein